MKNPDLAPWACGADLGGKCEHERTEEATHAELAPYLENLADAIDEWRNGLKTPGDILDDLGQALNAVEKIA